MSGQKVLGLPLKPVIDAMRQGKLLPIKRDLSLRGLQSLIFAHEDVERLFDEIQAGSSAAPTARLVAIRLRVTIKSVYGLLKRGYLSPVASSTSARLRISQASLVAFETEWVKGSDLAAQCGTSTPLIIRALRAKGINPIDAWQDVGTYYRRENIRAINLDNAITDVALRARKDIATYKREYRRRVRLLREQG